MSFKRIDGRKYSDLRPIKVTYDFAAFAASSVLFEIGKTKVLCTITIQSGVPTFLRGKNSGWLTAEYAMIPASTQERIARDSSTMKKNGRSIEISRFIGRVFRSIVDCSALAEHTIYIDCDVLQADGGTRTASITGAYLALELAQKRWMERGFLSRPFLTDRLAALSIGLMQGNILVDPDFFEDNKIDADFNFVLTASGKVIEIQGGAEKQPLDWSLFEAMRLSALAGVEKIFADLLPEKTDEIVNQSTHQKKSDLFSLKNRLTSS